MIELTRGNVLEADAEALVNTVNCQGFMGKGIALRFKQAYPENFRAYERATRAGEVQPGRMLVFETGALVGPKYIINFPTKRSWRGKSRIEDIKAGLESLISEVRARKIKSIAVPPLGCGLGGLDWDNVRPLIEAAFARVTGVKVLLFEPAGAPEARDMPVGTSRPHLTLARALFLHVMGQYSRLDYRMTLLEIQKLAYFLQEAGEPLRLEYVAHHYGPYAHNLNKVLELLEGHYIRGYGDQQKPDVEIELGPSAVEEAAEFLKDRPDSLARVNRVEHLIDGFETPYGMELLASVHWVASHGAPAAHNSEAVVHAIRNWNDRKRLMFKPEHVRLAFAHLKDQGWLASAAHSE